MMMSSRTCAFLTGLALGAGMAYFFDPRNGRRRRAIARDKMLSWARHAEIYTEKKARHLRNRAQGLAHEARNFASVNR
jgi:hypothetical protein